MNHQKNLQRGKVLKRSKSVWIVLLMVLTAAVSGCRSTSFVITDETFEASYQGDCETDVQIQASGDSLLISGSQDIHDGRPVMWCYGAKHTFIGEVTYAGYIFDSDKDDPLQFTVDKDRGYLYVNGTGTVTSPDGTVVSLPE